LTMLSDSVLYALDATTYRHALHDVRACKTALLKMKRLLEQDELNASVSCDSVENDIPFIRTCSMETAPVTSRVDCCFPSVPYIDELQQLRQRNQVLEVSKDSSFT